MTTSAFIESHKKLYKQLKPCFCPAIQETVHFNAEGLRHLLYSKNRPRNMRQKHDRMCLIPHLAYAITSATSAKIQVLENPTTRLWALEWVEVPDKKYTKIRMKIILRQNGNGNVHFLSAMSRKKGNTTKKNQKTAKK